MISIDRFTIMMQKLGRFGGLNIETETLDYFFNSITA